MPRSAASSSAIELQRSAGCLASALSTSLSSSGEIAGFFARSGGGGWLMCMSTTSPQPALTNGGAPVSIS